MEEKLTEGFGVASWYYWPFRSLILVAEDQLEERPLGASIPCTGKMMEVWTKMVEWGAIFHQL